MKKSLFTTVLLVICLIFISCGGGNTGSPSDDKQPTSVTPKELIQKIPMTIEEFDSQYSARSARTVALISQEDLEPIHDHGYENLSGADFSLTELYLTILKNDISVSPLLEFDKDIDISTIRADSDATQEYLEELMGPGVTGSVFFENIGTIRISYKDGLVTLFWSFIAITGDGDMNTVSVYITGTYSNDCYNALLTYTLMPDSTDVEKYVKNGTKTTMLESFRRNDDANNLCKIVKEGQNFIWYQMGSSDLATDPVPTERQLFLASQCRWIRYKNSSGAASFKYGKNNPAWKVYEIYDTDGSMMFYERMNLLPDPESVYTQRIPLKYLSWGSKILTVDDNGTVDYLDQEKTRDDSYYFGDDSANTIAAIDPAFGVEIGNSIHGYYPCYTLTNVSPDTLDFEQGSDFSMPRWNDVKAHIEYLDLLTAETNDPSFMADFITQPEIDEINDKLTVWLSTLD